MAEGIHINTGFDEVVPPHNTKEVPRTIGVLQEDVVQQLSTQVSLDDPGGSVPTRNMSSLSIKPNSPESNTRKRRAGSPLNPSDVPVRTESPFKFSRHSSGEQRLSPTSPIKQQFAQRSSSFRGPLRKFPGSPGQQSDLRAPSAALQTTGQHNEYPPERNNGKSSVAAMTRASQWSKKRPRGAHVTVNDSIAAVQDIYGLKELTAGFAFLNSADEFAYEDESEELPINTNIIKQPDARPISQQQLATEVKGIYSGLVMVEGKCVNEVNEHSQTAHQVLAGEKPASDDLQVEKLPALIALHRTLLHEHHDFFLASQHPSAGKGIKELAAKYSMPARMWKHGIHNFLELLRHQLPQSLDYMLAFIYLAYQMMALLFETVPTFEDTWIECLGDLARYRMAIEDEDVRDREVWTHVAKYWYMRAADKNPDIGRLLHHLGILARTSPLAQLSLYCRSLTANQPFLSSRESILTLFEPALARLNKTNSARPVSNDLWIVIVHACMFGVKVTPDLLERSRKASLSGLDSQIADLNVRWRELGAFLASCNVAALLKYGCTDSEIRGVLMPKEKPSDRPSCLSPARIKRGTSDPDGIADEDATTANISVEWHFAFECLSIALKRKDDANVLPLILVMLVFLWCLSSTPQGAMYINRFTPWELIATYVNSLKDNLDRGIFFNMMTSRMLLQTQDGPLPEDYVLRGQAWSNGLFSPTWFAKVPLDIDERLIEHTTFHKRRQYRVKWLAAQIAFNMQNAGGVNPQGQQVLSLSEDIKSAGPCRAYEFKTKLKWLDYNDKEDEFEAVSWSANETGQPSPAVSGAQLMAGIIST